MITFNTLFSIFSTISDNINVGVQDGKTILETSDQLYLILMLLSESSHTENLTAELFQVSI